MQPTIVGRRDRSSRNFIFVNASFNPWLGLNSAGISEKTIPVGSYRSIVFSILSFVRVLAKLEHQRRTMPFLNWKNEICMVATVSVSPEALSEIENSFRAAWTGANSTPFIVDAPISGAVRAKAEEVVKRLSLSVLLTRCPTLAVWAILTPLAQSYGASTKEVYLHISRFAKEDLSDNAARERLKLHYRIAARKIGLPVAGNEPTDLFFAPLGPPRSRHDDLAGAFVAAALHLGPPAIEDTPSARDWQRRAVLSRCPNIPRLLKTIAFDQSAHCSRRFEAWRKGSTPLNEAEAALFEAYDRAARRFGRKRSDLTGPPQIYWTGDRLALEAEPSTRSQTIKTGVFPTQIKSGARHAVKAPWPTTLTWRCGDTSREIPFGPGEGELLIFDADSGALLARATASTQEVEIAASRLVILSRNDFDSASFGPALPAGDPECRVAWVEPGDILTFPKDRTLRLTTPRETAIWIDAVPIGRAGSRALVSGDGALMIQLDPEIGGRRRIVRALLGGTMKYSVLDLAEDGSARVAFETFGFSPEEPPCKAVFEVLAPGAAGDFEARAELSVSTCLWPGLPRPEGPLLDLPRPSNHDPTRSAGLRVVGDRLEVDLAADVDAPILGLRTDDQVEEFVLRTGAEVLHHHRLARKDKVLVPRGGRVVLGHEGRHDTLVLQSTDRDADLLVLGQEFRRPFFASNRFEITPEVLEAEGGGDDRIALRRKDGRVEIFARIERRDDPAELRFEETDHEIVLDFLPQQRCDALRVEVTSVRGPVQQGDYTFGRHLAELGPLPGIRTDHEIDTGRLIIEIEKARFSEPARLSLWTRHADKPGFHPLEDGSGTPIAIGLGAPLPDPDSRDLGPLVTLAAEPVPARLANQHAPTIGRAYRDAMSRIGARKLVGPMRPALAATRVGGTPRHDLAGVAPWIFEASPHAYHGVPQECGLGPLALMATIGAVPDAPDPEGDQPLAQWLERLGGEDALPEGLSGAALASAFGALRFRLKQSDLKLLLGDGPHGTACACLCASWAGEIEALRAFDQGGGGDDRLAKIAAALERFARSCALGRAEGHLEDLAFRTGLSRAELGECLTLMLRAGIEVFVYFRALWSQAAQNAAARKRKDIS